MVAAGAPLAQIDDAAARFERAQGGAGTASALEAGRQRRQGAFRPQVVGSGRGRTAPCARFATTAARKRLGIGARSASPAGGTSRPGDRTSPARTRRGQDGTRTQRERRANWPSTASSSARSRARWPGLWPRSSGTGRMGPARPNHSAHSAARPLAGRGPGQCPVDRRRSEGPPGHAHGAAGTMPRSTIAGKIVFVSPEIDPVNGQVRVWAEIDNTDFKLRPGLHGSMVIADAAAGASSDPMSVWRHWPVDSGDEPAARPCGCGAIWSFARSGSAASAIGPSRIPSRSSTFTSARKSSPS